MSLSLSNITKSYDSQAILNGIDLLAKKGEVTALIGKNGAGKTTTFKTICGLVDSDQGAMQWEDKKIDSHSQDWKKKIGYLAEHNPLYKNLYVREFLTYACKLNDVQDYKTVIEETISQVGLEDHQHKQIKHLSKGYKQRVGLAQAIIHSPELLILDEPTSGLDPSQLIEIRALIQELSSDRVVILSSHILSEIEQICDKIYIIQQGKTVEYSENQGKESIRVIFNKKPQIKWFDSLGVTKRVKEKELSIISNSNNSREDIFDIAISNNLKILEMRSEKNELENAFIKSIS